MGWLTGFEPAHDGITIHCLNRLTTATTTAGEALTSHNPSVKTCLLARPFEIRHELQTFFRTLDRFVVHPAHMGVLPKRGRPEGLTGGCFCEYAFFNGNGRTKQIKTTSFTLRRGNRFPGCGQLTRIFGPCSGRQTSPHPQPRIAGGVPHRPTQVRLRSLPRVDQPTTCSQQILSTLGQGAIACAHGDWHID
jgi:hypothetical protein